MTHRRTAHLIATALLAVTLAGCQSTAGGSSGSSGSGGSLSGGSSGGGQTDVPMACGFDFFPSGKPVVALDSKSTKPRKIILITVKAVCAERPKTHALTLSILKRDTNGQYQTVATGNGDNRIPSTSQSDPTVYQFSIDCAAGVYQGHGDASGSNLAGQPFTGSKDSKDKSVNASDCATS